MHRKTHKKVILAIKEIHLIMAKVAAVLAYRKIFVLDHAWIKQSNHLVTAVHGFNTKWREHSTLCVCRKNVDKTVIFLVFEEAR